ncbi:MAG: cell division protein ZapA [Alphaproteobacteria bacterium]|nr:cell division protein ZapA [Alphaproteobacteria bacterium]
MSEITLTINGHNFGISCDNGQEQRVMDLGHYVDNRLKDISRAGAASNEAHLLVLTSLMLADEVFDLRNKLGELGGQTQDGESGNQDELVIAQAIDHLAERIDTIAGRIQKV